MKRVVMMWSWAERAWRRRAPLLALLLSLAAAAGVTAGAQAGRVVVKVTDSGFTPAEATAERGLLHLALVNGSSSNTVRIRVAREGGGQLREIEVAGEGATVGTELEAEAGVYTLTEAGHGWVFRLTVNAPPPTPTPTPEPPAEE